MRKKLALGERPPRNIDLEAALIPPPDPRADARDIRHVLATLPRATWSGPLAVLELADAGLTAITPASWPSAYFGLLGGRLLRTALHTEERPLHDGHRFTLRAMHTWELAAALGDGQVQLPRAIAVAANGGGVGIVVAEGTATGAVGEFASWFARFTRGSEARATAGDRKDAVAEFRVRTVRTFFFDGPQLQAAVEEGCLTLEDAAEERLDAPRGGYMLDLGSAAPFEV